MIEDFVTTSEIFDLMFLLLSCCSRLDPIRAMADCNLTRQKAKQAGPAGISKGKGGSKKRKLDEMVKQAEDDAADKADDANVIKAE